MELLIFALVVLVICALIVYAIQALPMIPSPFNNLLIVLVVLIAALVIAQRAGVF